MEGKERQVNGEEFGSEQRASQTTGDIFIAPKLATEMQQVLIRSTVTEDTEWSQSPESQGFIIDDRQYLFADPHAFHIRLLVGPSDVGKTTIATHMARTNEKDGEFAAQLQVAADNPSQQYLGLHLSLSHAMNEVSRRTGIPKSDLGEEHREEASALMLQTIRVAQQAFSERPDITVELFVDTVGLTESNLGTSVVTSLVHEENVRVFIPDPNEEVEEKGRGIRRYVASHMDDPNLDVWLEEQGQYHGRGFAGDASALVASAGNDAMWKRHWTDIYNQATSTYPDVAEMFLHAGETLEQFLEDFDLRRNVYHEIAERRFKDLGLHITGDRISWVNNDQSLTVHTHYDRVYGDDEKEGKRHQLPLSLVDGERPSSTYTYNELAGSMGLSEMK
jgi:hypothetical protein